MLWKLCCCTVPNEVLLRSPNCHRSGSVAELDKGLITRRLQNTHSTICQSLKHQSSHMPVAHFSDTLAHFSSLEPHFFLKAQTGTINCRSLARQISPSCHKWGISGEDESTSYINAARDSPSSFPCWNCSSRILAILAFFFRSSYFFWIFFERFLFSISSSSGV